MKLYTKKIFTRTSTRRTLIFLALLGCFNTSFQSIAQIKKLNTTLVFRDGAANNLTFVKDKYEVQRKWIKISNADQSENIAAFIYYPVLSGNVQDEEVLPNVNWQTDHYEKVRKKVGDSLATVMIKQTVKLATKGEMLNKKMPLIIFGPGLGWLPTDYTYLLASLASRGYLVVAITGVPISKKVYFPDQTFEHTDRVSADYKKMGDYFSLAISQILKRSENKETIFNLVDTSKVFVMGHSISGAATLMAAQHNDRIKGLINLDGDVNDEFKNIQPKQAILYVTTQPFDVSSTHAETWLEDRNELRRDNAFVNNSKHSIKSIRLKIPEMYHADFLDVAQHKEHISKDYNRKNYGSIPFARSSEIMIESITSFIENNNNWESFRKKYGIYIQIH